MEWGGLDKGFEGTPPPRARAPDQVSSGPGGRQHISACGIEKGLHLFPLRRILVQQTANTKRCSLLRYAAYLKCLLYASHNIVWEHAAFRVSDTGLATLPLLHVRDASHEPPGAQLARVRERTG